MSNGHSHNGCVTVALVGAGNRSGAYTRYSLSNPDRMKIVAVADPNPVHRRLAAERFNVPSDMQFESHEDIAKRPGLADAVLNCTREVSHYETAIPLLKAGYDMLLEKPIALDEAEVRAIIGAARENRRKVMICHVLRYAPFYVKIKEIVTSGVIGDIVSLRTLESLDYGHIATCYVRDRWHRRDKSGPMLLLKCCHDLDIIAWLLSGVPAVRVASFGSRKVYREENAPAGSGSRCMVDCSIEADCQYSARSMYVVKNMLGGAVWQGLRGVKELSPSNKEEFIRNVSPFGRCVWRCDNDQVDHQSVIVEFANGVTATHDMFGVAARSTRQIHVVGTKGELHGDMEEGKIMLSRPGVGPDERIRDEIVNVAAEVYDAHSHGGGDQALTADFISVLKGEPASKASTRIEDSLTGHLIAFAADTAMMEHRVVELL
ncbi:MAG: gfo/Idh/MocA family oxidoreductase [Verrucomicrobia bacterium]|nr:gfo/Idh/MocA family oxidoreductase [Verrucomicrobiota bacterium]